jgi:hypothetical protein
MTGPPPFLASEPLTLIPMSIRIMLKSERVGARETFLQSGEGCASLGKLAFLASEGPNSPLLSKESKPYIPLFHHDMHGVTQSSAHEQCLPMVKMLASWPGEKA